MLQRNKQGFTIVELLIVIVVIGILATIVIVAYNGTQSKARDTKRTQDVKSIQKIIEMYRINYGEYPLHSGGSVNVGYNMSSISSLLVPEFAASLPIDPSPPIVYQYVRGPAANNSYAIRVQYESKDDCKMGVKSASAGWWSLPDCS